MLLSHNHNAPRAHKETPVKYRTQGISILLARRATRRSRTFIEARLLSLVTKREIKQARQIALSIFG